MDITLDEAIRKQHLLIDRLGPYLEQDDLQVLTLGIEALKREQHRRKYDIHLPIELFPGETREV